MLFLSLLLTLIVAVILLIHHWSQNKGIVYLVGVLLFLSIREFSFLLYQYRREYTGSSLPSYFSILTPYFS